MRIALGLKAHSGWAALVTLGTQDDHYLVVDRRRIELVEQTWAKQPYHAAEGLKSDVARDLVMRGVKSAHRVALRELREVVKREQKRSNKVVACAVLVTDPMPGWSVDEILAVHFRMHKAEGVLFRDALCDGAKRAGVQLVEIHEKKLLADGAKVFNCSEEELTQTIVALGKSVGPPWGKDQKEAGLAAMIALHEKTGE